jgi:hypothetical protein
MRSRPDPADRSVEPVDAADVGREAASVVAGVAGTLLHLAIGVFVLSSGLLAPWWAVVALVALWGVLWVPIVRWRRDHPFRTMLVPFAMAAIWWAAITAGDTWLGWTA